MDGIVSLLDEEHYGWVEEIWAELDREFGLRGIYVTPFPHFTYHVAEHYEVEHIGAVLQRFAQGQHGFTVKTAGLGIFTGPSPVVYISLVRSPELARFHQALWQEIGDAGQGVFSHYRPEGWVPHTTLAYGDVDNIRCVPFRSSIALAPSTGCALGWITHSVVDRLRLSRNSSGSTIRFDPWQRYSSRVGAAHAAAPL